MKYLKYLVKNNKVEIIIFISIVILAAFLRLYQIRSHVVFLGDEGRDALVVKRILVDGELTLLGPTASVGGFFLGPVYYYFMVPFMFLWGLDPVGPAVMVALMSVSTLMLLYFVTRTWFGKFSAATTSLFYAVSPGIITFARSSWNPNPMPLFSLIAIACLHFGITRKRPILLLLSGISYGIAIQLHYLGLIIGPILAISTFVIAEKKHWTKFGLLQLVGFLIGASMFLAFELRHGFPNIKTILEFVSRGGDTTGPRSINLPWLFFEINRFNLEAVLGQKLQAVTPLLSYLTIFLAIAAVLKLRSKHKKLSAPIYTIIAFWIVGIVGIGSYKGQLYYHYFEFLFPAPFLLIGMILSLVAAKKAKIVTGFFSLVVAIYLVSQAQIWTQGSNLIDQTQRISAKALEMTQNQPFNFALIAQGNSDHAYRFFIEKNGARPTVLEDNVTQQLIVICEQPPQSCEPLGHPLWEIAGFGRAEIASKVIVHPDVTIFKLIHHQDSLEAVGKPANKG